MLLAGTAALYLVGLGRSGWANAYYAAAAQAGAQSWSAWFFGASDAPGLIMVDKPPAALWVMGLSARLFGVNAWSILVPQALMGVAAVGVLYAAVRRWAGPVAGLVAGAVLALTPVATLMFRFDNPDALLVLLLVAASWAVVRAVDAETVRRATGWLVPAAVLVGTGFLTKSLQAYLVLPALAATWLLAGPGTRLARWAALVPTAAALVVASGWWVAVVELWPAGSRPYVGGSQTDSVLELVLGYNGLGRLTGDEVGSVGPGGGGVPGGGGGGSGGGVFSTGTLTQFAWLLPAALILLVAMLVLAGRAPRTDRLRASAVLWGGSLLVTAAVLGLSQGIVHGYYTVALAPSIAALVGIGTVVLARRATGSAPGAARGVLAVTAAVTALWSWWLLRQSPEFLPWLRAVVLTGGLLVAAALALTAVLGRRAPARLLAGLVAAVVVLGVAAPAASSLQTAATAHEGSLPSAGPGGHGPGGMGPGGARGHDGGPRGPGGPAGRPPGAPGQRGPGGMGSLLQASRPGAELTALLRSGSAGHTWVAAAVGSNAAAGYQLASGAPVMALGGYNGTDPAPTLAWFQQAVATGQVHFFVGDESSASFVDTSSGGSDEAARIAAWVAAHYTPRTVDGTVVYDLAAAPR